MNMILQIFNRPDPEIVAWVLVAIIVIREFPRLTSFLGYLLMSLHKVFIQHNIANL